MALTGTLKPSSNLSVVIVGGGGYIGYHIGLQLLKKGHKVLLFDVIEPNLEWYEDLNPDTKLDSSTISGTQTSSPLEFRFGNVTSIEDLRNAFSSSNANCVVHCASYGMSGKEQMPPSWDKTEEINVTGTVNVIRACCSCGINSLLYTSTFNVIFGGQEIINGDESLPYFPLHRHVDHYSRTKSIAEQLVLLADKKSTNVTADDNKLNLERRLLRTSALRLAGVMGVKEKRHLPRIVNSLPFLKFRYGSEDMRVQFVSMPNVCQAHVKALEGLSTAPDILGGQAYFISDGVAINHFEYLRPLIEGLGYTFPKFVVRLWVIWGVVHITQLLYTLLGYLNISFTPFLAPCEVFKTSVTHYFSIEKARRDFGYDPEKSDMSEVVKYYKKKGETANQSHLSGLIILVVSLAAALLMTYFCL